MGRPRGSIEQAAERRRKAIELFEQGRSSREVAEAVKASVRSVNEWRQRHREQGEAGIAARKGGGSPPKLTEEQRAELIALLDKGALAAGFDTDLWTCPRVKQLIKERFGVDYHVDHLSRLLRQLGFTAQKPRRRAFERDEQAIEQWVREDWPRVKKKR